MPRLLSFDTEGLEEAFMRRRNLQLMRLDATWAVMWLMFQVAGFDASERQRFPWSEIAILTAWGAWMPLLIFLIRFRTEWYVRHRNWLMCALRMCRTFMVMNSRLPWREAKYVGSYNAVPRTPWQIYLHLYWKANLLFFGAVTFVTPMRYTIPLQLASLLITLVFSAQRCRLECGVDASTLCWPLNPSSCPGICAMGEGAGVAAAGAVAVATKAGGSCIAPANPVAAERYYSTVANWVSRLLIARFDGQALGGGWQPGSACLALCFSVHSWLQSVGGVLVPLAVLWALEERLRCREVCALQEQRHQQLQAIASSGGRQEDPAAVHGTGRFPQPLTALTLVCWLASSAWLLWVTLEAVLL